jgi:hypothetical protein
MSNPNLLSLKLVLLVKLDDLFTYQFEREAALLRLIRYPSDKSYLILFRPVTTVSSKP